VREKPALFRVGRPSALLPEKSYQELLYEEGMLGKEEREKWRQESVNLLSACEQRECTFRPRLNDNSRDLMRGQPPLTERTEEVLETQKARRQALADVVLSREMEALARPALASPIVGPLRRTANEVVADLCWRAEEMRNRRQLVKAELEALQRKEETFAPMINSWRVPLESSGTPVFERLYAMASGSPGSARSDAHSVKALPAPHRHRKHQSPLAAQKHTEELYGEAASHRARHDARLRAAQEAAQAAAAQPKVNPKSRRLALDKARRELQALYDQVSPTGEGLSQNELHLLLARMLLVREPAVEQMQDVTSVDTPSRLGLDEVVEPIASAEAAVEMVDNVDVSFTTPMRASAKLMDNAASAPTPPKLLVPDAPTDTPRPVCSQAVASCDSTVLSPAGATRLVEEGALVRRLHNALADGTGRVPFRALAALLIAESREEFPSFPARQAAALRLAAKSRASQPAPHPTTEEAQLLQFSFHPDTASSAASYAELSQLEEEYADSPLRQRAERMAVGGTVFEQLYRYGAEIRGKHERLRTTVRERDMVECTFQPNLNKAQSP